MATWTFSFVSFTSFTISRAFSTGIPCCSTICCFAVPAGPGSIGPACRARSGTWRRASFSCSSSFSARNLNSSAERRWRVWSSRRTSVGVFLKSKRWPTSRKVCWIALSTSCRSTRQTASKNPIGRPSIGRGTDHVNPGRRGEAEESRIERDVAALVREQEARRRPQRIGDAGLLQCGVGLADHEHEAAEPLVAVGNEAEHPALGPVLLQTRREVALEPSEAGEEGDGGVGAERLGEGRLDHLMVVGLVDPEGLAIADHELRIGRLVVP